MSAQNPRIAPFRALLFNRSRVGRLEDVVAPPYDLIDQNLQEAMYARSPFNIVRLELNRDADPYSSAAATLADWRSGGVLELAQRPSIYFYTQRFELEGRRFVRNGLIARIRLDEFTEGKILPHERTFPKAKEDRLRLLTATRLNVSPIFGLYPTNDAAMKHLLAEVASRPPAIDINDDLGIANEIRSIDAPLEIDQIQQALANARVLIADGHHRYETALEYARRRRREAAENSTILMPYDYVMMTLVAFDDPGLVILPTHRVMHRRLQDLVTLFDARACETFEIENFVSADALCEAVATRGHGSIGVALKGDPDLRLLRLKDPAAVAAASPEVPRAVRELDVLILHSLIFDRIFGIKPEEVRTGGNIEYTIDARGALQAVAAGRADGAFLMAPPTVSDVARVSEAGATMPEKSTYFHPKLLTGLVMNPLDE